MFAVQWLASQQSLERSIRTSRIRGSKEGFRGKEKDLHIGVPLEAEGERAHRRGLRQSSKVGAKILRCLFEVKHAEVWIVQRVSGPVGCEVEGIAVGTVDPKPLEAEIGGLGVQAEPDLFQALAVEP